MSALVAARGEGAVQVLTSVDPPRLERAPGFKQLQHLMYTNRFQISSVTLQQMPNYVPECLYVTARAEEAERFKREKEDALRQLELARARGGKAGHGSLT